MGGEISSSAPLPALIKTTMNRNRGWMATRNVLDGVLLPISLFFLLSMGMVAISGAATPSLPITLTNYQTANAVAGLQVIVSFNPSNSVLSPYEAADLGNIRFYQSNAPANPANALYSWCEQGCSSAAANAVFWVRLTNSIGNVLTTSNALSLNMTFLPMTTEYDGNVAGEAPQLSITGSTIIYNTNAITYTANFVSTASSSINMITIGGHPNYWICGTSQSNSGGGNPNYNIEASDNADLAAFVGYNTSNNCADSGSGEYAGAIIGVNSPIAPVFYSSSSGSGGALQFITVSNSFTVIIVMCGYTGGCTPTGGGDITGIPNQCNSLTPNSITTSDLGASASLYVCNSLPASSYNIGADVPNGDYVEGAWVFYNLNNALDYAKYDNGQNVFNFYMNANSVPASIPANFMWGTDGADSTFAENSMADLVKSNVGGETALVVNSLQYPHVGGGGGDEYVFFMPSNNIPQSYIATLWGYTIYGGGTSYDIGTAGSSTANYPGYWSLFGDNGQNQMSLFWDTLTSRILISNIGTGPFPGYNTWYSTGLEYNSTSHYLTSFAYNSFGLEVANIYSSVSNTLSTIPNSYVVFGGYVYVPSIKQMKYYGVVTVRNYPPNGILPGVAFGSLVTGATTSSTTTTVPQTPFTGGMPPSSASTSSATTTAAPTTSIPTVSTTTTIPRTINATYSVTSVPRKVSVQGGTIAISSQIPVSVALRITNVTNYVSPPGSNTTVAAFNVVAVAPGGAIMTQNVTISMSLLYPCAIPANGIAPYKLVSGTWTRISGFTVNASACTVSFFVPPDPIVALFRYSPPPTTTRASTTAPTTLPSTFTTTAPQVEQSQGSSNATVIAVAVIAIAAAAAYYLFRRKAKTQDTKADTP